MTKLIGAIVIIVVIIAIGWYAVGRSDDTPQPQGATQQASELAVSAETVAYFPGVNGYIARPSQEGNYPGVVMIHEWWGLNDNIRREARELAAEGYIVLAVDLYNGKIATTPDQARQYRTELNQDTAIQNLRSAVAHVRDAGAEKVASLGWCFGGGQSLSLALSGEKLDATVIYYGQLVDDPATLRQIEWPVLGIFGAEDTSIPVADVAAFEEGLASNNIPHSIHIYPGVGHAFANPSGDNYAPNETADAWAKTLAFLNEHLK
jgi:carboxymethylenebutenolidase